MILLSSAVESSVTNKNFTINIVENNDNNDGSDDDYVQLRKFSAIEVVSEIDNNSSIKIIIKDCQELDYNDDDKDEDNNDDKEDNNEPMTSSTPITAPISLH